MIGGQLQQRRALPCGVAAAAEAFLQSRRHCGIGQVAVRRCDPRRYQRALFPILSGRAFAGSVGAHCLVARSNGSRASARRGTPR